MSEDNEEPAEPDWSCRVCGKPVMVIPAEMERGWCVDCCPDHDYEYDRHERGHFCKTCGQPAPPDFYSD